MMIGQGKQINGMYILDFSSSVTESSIDVFFSSYVVIDASLWHSKLAHLSYGKIDLLKNELGLQKRSNEDSYHCATCQLAKQKKLSFHSQNNMTTNAFDLVYIDTWEPFSVKTLESYRYFLIIVDNHTRNTWIYLMKRKDEVLTVFLQFLKMIENQKCEIS